MTEIKPAVTAYTVAKVGQLLGVSRRTVLRYADTGRLRCFRTLGGHRRFYADDVHALKADPALADARHVQLTGISSDELAAAADVLTLLVVDDDHRGSLTEDQAAALRTLLRAITKGIRR
ncbi:MerR family transcriptional regulator [Nonomuraea aridisoli]|uniref:Helix-turn-helix domain-containing protein n=1 Tax=Nonomuraea aridisoli TaxID=2070368 RepID=A0A2W2G105_9ACTN|nr:helix-turn-helix domain-containing protein [Nonomuraea aridisoli]PZG20574.1 hypothetical protein C1J01_08710 [Nonomuraea aridisoli]